MCHPGPGEAEIFNRGITPLAIVKQYVGFFNEARPKLKALDFAALAFWKN